MLTIRLGIELGFGLGIGIVASNEMGVEPVEAIGSRVREVGAGWLSGQLVGSG